MEATNTRRLATRKSHNYKSKKSRATHHIFSTAETIEKSIHKVYLVLALLLGMMLSVGMPFFNEPDGVYHYVNSSNIVGLTTDISAYGETSQWYGYQFEHEKPNYINGTFFQKYYETPIELMPMSDLPRSSHLPSITSYNFWGHLIPAAGVWLGYHIYPSLGVMITVARMFNTFVLAIAMFFVIRFVKRGKLVIALVGLSPVILNTFASLSYDGLSFVLASILIAIAINIICAQKLSLFRVISMILISAAMGIAAKTNLVLLILLFPLIIYSIFDKGRTAKLWKKLGKTVKISSVVVLLAAIGVLAVKFSSSYGGIVHVVYKFFINIMYNFNTSLNVQDVNTILVQPLATHNKMPFWLTSAWFILLVLAVLAEKKYVKSLLVSWGALGIFILNIVGLYLSFFTGYTSGRNEAMGAIGGVQGRYFTPMLMLFSIFIGNEKFRLKVLSYKTVAITSFFIIILSNGLLLFDTLFTILRF